MGPAIQTSMGSRAVQRPGAMQGKAIEQNSKERKLSDAAAAPDLFPTAYITRGFPTCNCRISSTMSECYITENGHTEVVTWDNRYLWCNAWKVFFSKNFFFVFPLPSWSYLICESHRLVLHPVATCGSHQSPCPTAPWITEDCYLSQLTRGHCRKETNVKARMHQ